MPPGPPAIIGERYIHLFVIAILAARARRTVGMALDEDATRGQHPRAVVTAGVISAVVGSETDRGRPRVAFVRGKTRPAGAGSVVVGVVSTTAPAVGKHQSAVFQSRECWRHRVHL